MHVDIVDVN